MVAVLKVAENRMLILWKESHRIENADLLWQIEDMPLPDDICFNNKNREKLNSFKKCPIDIFNTVYNHSGVP